MGQLSVGSSEVIATLALLASVISLIVSWRTGYHSTKITTYRSATDLTLDIDRIFVEHPTLRKYFYDGADVDDADEKTRPLVEAIAELMLDCFECIWDIRATYKAVDRGSWGRYVLSMLSTSPVMREMLKERAGQDWYPALADLKKASENGSIEARTIRALRWARRLWQAGSPEHQSTAKSLQED